MISSHNSIRIIKPEAIKVPTFPNTGHQMVDWRTKLGTALVTASNQGDMAEIAWLGGAWALGATFEGLALSEINPNQERFGALDIKLAAAMAKQIRGLGSEWGILKDRLTQEEHKAGRDGLIIKGRQMVFLLIEHMKINQDSLQAQVHMQFVQMTLKGNDYNAIYTFVREWDSFLFQLGPVVAEWQKRQYFYEKLAHAKPLAEDWAAYRRFKDEDPDRTYAWLRGQVDSYLQREALKRNTDAQQKAMEKGFHSSLVQQAMPGPKADGKGKDKKDKKGKKGDKKDGKKAGNGKGKGDPNGPNPYSTPKMQNGIAYTDVKGNMIWSAICNFHNSGGCKKGKECKFAHVLVKEELKHHLNKLPEGKGGGGGKGKKGGDGKGGKSKANAKAKPKGQGKGDVKKTYFCHDFLKPGGCKKPEGACKYPHLSQEAVDKLKAANK